MTPNFENPVKVLIRYNTRNDNDSPFPWRVLVATQTVPDSNSVAQYLTYFAENIFFEVPSKSTQDEIADGIVKWHMSAVGRVSWKGKDCYII